jgi:hypothetical protein
MPFAGKSKSAARALLRTATFADGLAIPGGAPTYDYEGLSNKIAHPGALSAFHCHAIGAEIDRVKRSGAAVYLARDLELCLQIVIGDGRRAPLI